MIIRERGIVEKELFASHRNEPAVPFGGPKRRGERGEGRGERRIG